MSDLDDEGRPPPTPTEGVRILGAEEAQAALDAGAARPALPSDDDDFAAPDPPAPVEPADIDVTDDEIMSRFPSEGPTWSASTSMETPTGEHEIPPLPHWTEPPTGAVPAIFTNDDGNEDDSDLDAWAGIAGGQPRFRAEGSDWAEADFARGELDDDAVRIGALAEAPVDEDVAFEQELAARRPRGRAPVAARTGAPAARAARTSETTARPAPPSGRDLPTALATAAIIAAIALLCFSMGTFWTALLAAVVVGAATLEFCSGLQEKGFRPATLLATIGSAGLVLAARHYGVGAYPVVFFVVVVFSFLWFLLEITPGRPALGVATTLLAFGYVGGLGGFAGLLLQDKKTGIGLILGVVICVIAYDVVGFFVGSQFGKTPIAPKVSPNKTVQGTVAGMIAALVFGAIVGQIHPWTTKHGLILGLLVAIGAFLGDLCESLLKRDLGIKDFGTVLPGHGGVLDRFDALLFCLPIAFYLALHYHLV